MSREIRHVPADWKHPTNGFYSDGKVKYLPLYDNFKSSLEAWDEGKAKWDKKEYSSWVSEESKVLPYDEYYGPRPAPEKYMPDWPEEEKTHLMFYETTSEGTPQSPAFKTVEELARWLADNGATTFGYSTASYETWLDFCRAGSSHGVTFAMGSEGVVSGVEIAAQGVADKRRSLNVDYDGDMLHGLVPAPQLPLREITLREFYNLSLSMKNKIRKIRRTLHK